LINFRLIVVKARQSAQVGSVLRLLLAKYGIDLDKVVVCLAGTSEVLQHSASINRADRRKLIVMSQQEFQGMHKDILYG
jgi:hypothetical protein